MKALTGAEQGFLLLTSQLGDPARKPLTVAQFRELTRRMQEMPNREPDRELELQDLQRLGYGSAFAGHILELLEEEALLQGYMARARKQDCMPITRATENYPVIVRRRLGTDAPGVLWARGDLSLLDEPAIALVGSRELRQENRVFAEEVGRQAAGQGLTLVSGNARGADKAAQNACLKAGGKVISVVADSLLQHKPKENVLYLSENSYDEEFSSQRALSRNRVIHVLGRITFAAQSDLHKGGTWDGTAKNLRHGWSPVACFRDGSEAAAELEQMGAYLIGTEDLKDFCALQSREVTLFDLQGRIRDLDPDPKLWR